MQDQIDSVLLSYARLASQNVGPSQRGVAMLLDGFFSFLQRKTDFYTGVPTDKAEEMVIETFRKYAGAAQKKDDDAKKEGEARQKRQEEAAKVVAAREADARAAKAKAAADAAAKAAVQKPVSDNYQAKVEELPSDDDEPTKKAKKDGDKDDDDDDDKPKGIQPTLGNGSTTETYSWTQTLREVEISVPFPRAVKAREVAVKIEKKHVTVGIKGETPILDADFPGTVDLEDSCWVVDGDNLVILQVVKDAKMEWWKSATVGETEIDLSKIVPEDSKLDDLDGETRQMVEKMMFDQRAKAMGQPTSDERQKLAMLEKFKASHPELDFSKAKIC